jgi:hypothetical protein
MCAFNRSNRCPFFVVNSKPKDQSVCILPNGTFLPCSHAQSCQHRKCQSYASVLFSLEAVRELKPI